MSVNVCEAPQTPKTTKICAGFLIFRYNRDPYTNSCLLPVIIPVHFEAKIVLALKVTSCKNYYDLSDPVEMGVGRRGLLACHRMPLP